MREMAFHSMMATLLLEGGFFLANYGAAARIPGYDRHIEFPAYPALAEKKNKSTTWWEKPLTLGADNELLGFKGRCCLIAARTDTREPML